MRVQDGKVGVVALEGGEEGLAEGRVRVSGEGRARVEVFYYGLGGGVSWLYGLSDLGGDLDGMGWVGLTPR